MDEYDWQSAGGGSFSTPTNWLDVETGEHEIPPPDGQTFFDVNVNDAGPPLTYTVICDGQSVNAVTCYDNVTFSGGLSANENIGGAGDITLLAGTYAANKAITARGALSCAGATLNADTIAATGGLNVSAHSVFNATGDSGIAASGAISINGATFNAKALNINDNGHGTINHAKMTISTGSLIGDGDIVLTGSFGMDGDALHAVQEVTLLGTSDWTDGSVKAKTLSTAVNPSGGGGPRIDFDGTKLTTSTVVDSTLGSGVSKFILDDATWTNSGSVRSSATYWLTGQAHFTTKTFVAGATGAGATIRVNNRSMLSINGDLAAVTLTDMGGGKTTVAGNAKLLAMAGSVTGAGSKLAVAGDLSFVLAGGSPFSVAKGGAVSAESVSAANGAFTVEGAGATLTVNAKLIVDFLQVGNGGSASASAIDLGSGALTVDGGAVSTGSLVVATLAISAAGSLKIGGSLTIGNHANAWNMGTVSGAGSTLSVGGALTIGSSNDGALTISSGGTAKAKDVTVAGSKGGSILIKGSKSLLSAGATLTVGSNSGRGDMLSAEAGGLASVGSSLTLFDGDQISLTQGGAITVGGASAVGNTIAIGSGGTFWEKSDSGSAVAGSVKGSVADNGALTLLAGSSLTIAGSLRGSGEVTLDAKSELEVQREASTRIGFDGAGATLTLSDAIDFSGRISGFANSDAFDLGDIIYKKGKDFFSVDENAQKTAAILKVSDGSHTASIGLVGNYVRSDFLLGPGLDGGVLITDRGAH